MPRIIPKLNLNKTPSIIESNSLVFAKNIRLDVDGSIHQDYGVWPMSIHKGNNTRLLVNHDNILNRILSDVKYYISNNENIESYIHTVYAQLRYISGEEIRNSNNIIIAKNGIYRIVGVIANSNEFYIFINGSYTTGELNIDGTKKRYNLSFIVCYDEKEDRFYPCNCNWNWSGGTITGCVINNLLGEKILNIGEKDATTLVPLKCINLSVSSINDNERIYTQTPNIPITNLNYIGDFNYVIPNGVYQFFIRYKIRDNFYTNWFPASKELFAGNKNITKTSFGTVKFVNTHRDSDSSFKFSVEHLFPNQTYNYKSFQIGFIISHDDAIMARAWKHFDFSVNTINFDYNAKDAYEIEVIDLLKTAYQLYNVGNITSFKNKLYISNYQETDFNENHQDLANDVIIKIANEISTNGYAGYTTLTTNINSNEVISGLNINNNNLSFKGENGIIHSLLKLSNNNNDESVESAIQDAIGENTGENTNCGAKNWAIEIRGNKISLIGAKEAFKKTVKSTKFNFETDIKEIKVDGNNIEVIENKENLLKNILAAIYNKNRYLNDSCIFINENGVEDNHVTVEIIRDCSYEDKYWVSNGLPNNNPVVDNKENDSNTQDPAENVVGPGISTNPTNGHWEVRLRHATYTQTIKLTLLGDITQYNKPNMDVLIKNTTLIPYQKYKFYIHYIKQNGEITNGYYCNGKNAGIIEAPYRKTVNSIIYPVFKNIKLPKGYVACFFSIVHVENIVGTIYDIDVSDKRIEGEASCIDIDTGLLAGSNNITIKQGKVEAGVIPPLSPLSILDEVTDIKTDGAQYHYSSDTSNLRYFGSNGVITFDKNSGITNGKAAYVVNKYHISEAEDVQLIKCTPFINPKILSTETTEDNKEINVYSTFLNANLLGFICAISPLDRERSMKYYTDGSSIYYKLDFDKNNTSQDNAEFKLEELKNHLEDADNIEKRLTYFNVCSTQTQYVYSNYNLNYLILSEDPIETYKSYYLGTSENTSDKAVAAGTLILRLFKSLTLSSVYTLPSMYKTYTRKIYSIYKNNEITLFNNTVRSSKLEGDESSINIYKFDPNDYYNVPTNRGRIVNLIAIGDAILIHTEDSMFKFSGSNTLQSSDGEIQPTENNVFETGVSEVFGSDFGFAGLQYKTDCITTEKGYIFFDRDSRIIYMYSGQGQIVKISDSIEKLFRHKPIENIRFANDYYNNRFFVSILFYDKYIKDGEMVIRKRYHPVTLSFNLGENVKSFVSLHDFYYIYAFNTKTKCYFLTFDNKDVCYISDVYKGYYTKLELSSDKTYLQNSVIKTMLISKEDSSSVLPVEYSLKQYNSIVDIIDNSNYELVKTLNAVNWCGTKVNSEFRNIDTLNEVTLNMVEEVNDIVPCKYIRIYSDTCMTNLLPCTSRSNDKSISSLDSYKYPFYHQGYWTFNYFRNILNSNNNKIKYSGDENSLVEGKYFVVRFIFDSDFKIETLDLNTNIK